MPTVTWAVDADGDWSNAADWSGGAVPAAGAAVLLASTDPHTVTHSLGTDTIATLLAVTDVVSLTGGEFAIQSGATFDQTAILVGGTLALAGTSNIAGNAFTVDQADLRIAKGASLTTAAGAAIGQNGGFAAATTIEGAGTLASTASTVIQSNLSLGGGLTWSNTGTVNDAAFIYVGTSLGSTATLRNAAGAVFDLTTAGSGIGNSTVVINGVTETGQSTFDNAGLLAITDSADSDFIGSVLINTGTLAVNGGTAILTGGGTLGGTITGGGAVWLLGGAYTINKPTVLDGTAVTLFAGTLSIGAHQSVAWLTVAGGEVDGPGTLLNSGTMSLPQQIVLGGGLLLRNTGLVILNSTYLVAGDGGTPPTIDNLAGATFDLDGAAELSTFVGSLPPRFINAGLIESDASSAAGAQGIAASLTSTGTISVGAGQLALYRGGALGGVVTGGGTLELAGGLFSLTAAKREGGTRLLLAGGTVAIAAGHTLADLTLGSGEIDGPGTLATAAAVTPAGSVSLTLGDGLTWTNSAKISLGAITVGSPGAADTIINTAQGVLDFAGDSSITNPLAGVARLTNAGLLEKTAGSGTSGIAAQLVSTGTLEVASGTLALQAGGTLSGRIEGAGTLLLAGGQFVLQSPSISGGTSIILAGGTLAIAAGQTASPAFTGGEIDGPGTLSTSGTVAISAALGLALGAGLTWANSGTVTMLVPSRQETRPARQRVFSIPERSISRPMSGFSSARPTVPPSPTTACWKRPPAPVSRPSKRRCSAPAPCWWPPARWI